eukprot:TRINITY_DN1222_c6_g1_i1.p1 TRINITY_DN1222_c6_g1~~TRINITY_DN1222_c6_g1_i1.p1  ORF type:complete len:348 (+),score=68.38 TRINITY_DN1222_c6_g1_i1:65-1108(+)
MADQEQDLKKTLNQLFDEYILAHNEKEKIEELKGRAGALFDSLEGQDKINLYKYLPNQLIRHKSIECLQIEKESQTNSIAKMLSKEEVDMGNINDTRKALHLIYECLKAGDTEEGMQPLVSLLKTYDSNETATPGIDTESLASIAVLNHFKYGMKLGQNPTSWQFDTICGLRAVRNLQTSRDNECRLLYTLLYSIFAAGKCSEYMSFYAQNKALIEGKWNLENDTLTSKVRTLSLCTLCSEAGQSVSYTAISQALCIATEEVEMYVIEAMSLGLLNAKIDSMSQQILVKSVHHPLLETTHWSVLRDKLLSWYTAVGTQITTFDEVRVQQVKEDREQDRIEANAGRHR